MGIVYRLVLCQCLLFFNKALSVRSLSSQRQFTRLIHPYWKIQSLKFKTLKLKTTTFMLLYSKYFLKRGSNTSLFSRAVCVVFCKQCCLFLSDFKSENYLFIKCVVVLKCFYKKDGHVLSSQRAHNCWFILTHFCLRTCR